MLIYRDVSERDPIWLKGKGDEFYQKGDYKGAVNAYSAAIDIDPEFMGYLFLYKYSMKNI